MPTFSTNLLHRYPDKVERLRDFFHEEAWPKIEKELETIAVAHGKNTDVTLNRLINVLQDLSEVFPQKARQMAPGVIRIAAAAEDTTWGLGQLSELFRILRDSFPNQAATMWSSLVKLATLAKPDASATVVSFTNTLKSLLTHFPDRANAMWPDVMALLAASGRRSPWTLSHLPETLTTLSAHFPHPQLRAAKWRDLMTLAKAAAPYADSIIEILPVILSKKGGSDHFSKWAQTQHLPKNNPLWPTYCALTPDPAAAFNFLLEETLFKNQSLAEWLAKPARAQKEWHKTTGLSHQGEEGRQWTWLFHTLGRWKEEVGPHDEKGYLNLPLPLAATGTASGLEMEIHDNEKSEVKTFPTTDRRKLLVFWEKIEAYLKDFSQIVRGTSWNVHLNRSLTAEQLKHVSEHSDRVRHLVRLLFFPANSVDRNAYLIEKGKPTIELKEDLSGNRSEDKMRLEIKCGSARGIPTARYQLLAWTVIDQVVENPKLLEPTIARMEKLYAKSKTPGLLHPRDYKNQYFGEEFRATQKFEAAYAEFRGKVMDEFRALIPKSIREPDRLAPLQTSRRSQKKTVPHSPHAKTRDPVVR